MTLFAEASHNTCCLIVLPYNSRIICTLNIEMNIALPLRAIKLSNKAVSEQPCCPSDIIVRHYTRAEATVLLGSSYSHGGSSKGTAAFKASTSAANKRKVPN